MDVISFALGCFAGGIVAFVLCACVIVGSRYDR